MNEQLLDKAPRLPIGRRRLTVTARASQWPPATTGGIA
jgi:hypothetical protein